MTMATAQLVIVGGGRMGSALARGLLEKEVLKPEELAVVEADAARRHVLEGEFPAGVAVVASPDGLPGGCEGAVLAVKPDHIEEACIALAAEPSGSPDQGRGGASVRRVLSIAAGVPTGRIEDWLGGRAAVVRAMPNTPALVGVGVAAIASGRHASEEDLQWAEELLGSVGTTLRVAERMMDAVTGLSGSGPAYLFLVAEALVEGGVMMGLAREDSSLLAAHTLLGAAMLWIESGQDLAYLRGQVTSPGGTTAAGLQVLEQRAVRAAIVDAVRAAAERSRELGR